MSVLVLELDRPEATDPDLVGAKAANLARCAAAGMPTMPGFVITTSGVERGLHDVALVGELRRHREALVGATDAALVVRSSSTIEDAGESSMAGQFTSVLDVIGWTEFVAAVERVIASAASVTMGHGPQPMAVLVQIQVTAPRGGVLFGVDPVSGDRRRVMVEVVPNRPDTLVDGTVIAAHYVLSRRGRVVESRHAEAAPPLGWSLRRRLCGVARQAERRFHRPQDIEWAVDGEDHLWVLQSRPITAIPANAENGCVMGPGPVAETFPAPLRRLEADLWIVPLRDGIVRALLTTGAASQRQIDASPVLTTVGGWAAVDLELLGLTRGQVPWRNRINPSWILHHLVAAWRVGRTRVALPALAATVVAAVDDHLSAVPAVEELADGELLDLMASCRRELTTVHCYEVLAGMLLRDSLGTIPTGIVALHELAKGRRDRLDDDRIIERAPVVLALLPPSIADPPTLPPTTRVAGPAVGVDDLGVRDSLRLRTRWLQELLGRSAQAIAGRLVAAGAMGAPELVRELGWDELEQVVGGAPPPGDLRGRAGLRAGPPLPESFRIVANGVVAARPAGDGAAAAGTAAGGGRATGVVCHRPVHGEGAAGRVLVTRHLEPQLAPLLGDIDALVSETGSTLSHLAILAREMGVATVVGVPDALRRFPIGSRILVDGGTGQVRALSEEEAVLVGAA